VIRGKIWRVLRDMYRNTRNCVHTGSQKTEFFDIDVGVRQGCVLSPILLPIYINGLAHDISSSGFGIQVGGKDVAVLLYADDIVLISDCEADLQALMDLSSAWGFKWRCTFNQKKSKVVVFGEWKIISRPWKLGGKDVEQLSSYNYLGLDIKSNLSWDKFRERLLEKAKKTMMKSWAMGIRSGFLSVEATVKTWKILVRPLVEYGSEIWGVDTWREAEMLQRNMGRRILGLKRSTNNEVVCGELVWWPVRARILRPMFLCNISASLQVSTPHISDPYSTRGLTRIFHVFTVASTDRKPERIPIAQDFIIVFLAFSRSLSLNLSQLKLLFISSPK
jgi:hypothetical protein